jgi:hypothetical protein
MKKKTWQAFNVSPSRFQSIKTKDLLAITTRAWEYGTLWLELMYRSQQILKLMLAL